MRLIGLTGKARSGKDTAATFLEMHDGYRGLALAGPIKRAIPILFGIPIENTFLEGLKDSPDPTWGLTPRYMMQRLGTEAMRNAFGHDFWIRRLFMEIDQIRASVHADSFVITDVRFDNEAQAIRERGGVILEIVRPSYESALEQDAKAHVSERGVDKKYIHRTILNDSTIEVFNDRISDAIDILSAEGCNV